MIDRETLRRRALELLDRAVAAKGLERHQLIEEALRLHRLSVFEELGRRPSDPDEAEA